MVAKGDGLGALQVGIARHYCPGEGFGLDADSLSQFFDLFPAGLGLLSQIEPDIQRTWSFRLLAVCSRLPVSPSRRVNSPSMKVWISSWVMSDFQRPGL